MGCNIKLHHEYSGKCHCPSVRAVLVFQRSALYFYFIIVLYTFIVMLVNKYVCICMSLCTIIPVGFVNLQADTMTNGNGSCAFAHY